MSDRTAFKLAYTKDDDGVWLVRDGKLVTNLGHDATVQDVLDAVAMLTALAQGSVESQGKHGLRPASEARIALVAAVIQCVEAGVPIATIREVVEEEIGACCG